jgi:hypothetical protein
MEDLASANAVGLNEKVREQLWAAASAPEMAGERLQLLGSRLSRWVYMVDTYSTLAIISRRLSALASLLAINGVVSIFIGIVQLPHKAPATPNSIFLCN